MLGLRDALSALTVAPGRVACSSFTVAWFPLVGALLGWMASGFVKGLGSYTGAIAAIAVLTLLTGGRHEVGLASAVSEPLPRRMAVAGGILAIGFTVTLRVWALARLQASDLDLIPVCLAASRAAMAGQAWLTRPADETSLLRLTAPMRSVAAIVAIAIAVVFALITNGERGIAVMALCYVAAYGWNRLAEWRAGLSMAILRAAGLSAETLALAVLAASRV